MGTQQLFLIVLAIIVVGAAIAFTSQLFESNSEFSTQDSIVSESLNLGTLAQQYYNKSTELAGGSKSFIGWLISASLASTLNGTYLVEKISKEELIIIGKPDSNKKYDWYIKTTITRINMESEVVKIKTSQAFDFESSH